jgi:hypothetical protein
LEVFSSFYVTEEVFSGRSLHCTHSRLAVCCFPILFLYLSSGFCLQFSVYCAIFHFVLVTGGESIFIEGLEGEGERWREGT